MNFSKFIVSYKYLDKSFSKKKILWSLNHLKQIGKKYIIKFFFNRKNNDSKINYIFLSNNEKILRKNFRLKIFIDIIALLKSEFV